MQIIQKKTASKSHVIPKGSGGVSSSSCQHGLVIVGKIEVEPGRENLSGEPLGEIVLPGAAVHAQGGEPNPGFAEVGDDVSASVETLKSNPVDHPENLAILG